MLEGTAPCRREHDAPRRLGHNAVSSRERIRYTRGVPPETSPSTLDETFLALRDLAHRRFGKIPPELIAAQIIAATRDADWPVRGAAVEALVRRYRLGQRDGLMVAKRPTSPFGEYRTARRTEEGSKRPSRQGRPYSTVLTRVVPLEASCDCADFISSSLGVCKHVLVILDELFAKRKLENLASLASAVSLAGNALTWAPDLALRGPLDRLTGLQLRAGERAVLRGWIERRSRTDHDAADVWRRVHDVEPTKDDRGLLVLDMRALANPDRRSTVLRDLASRKDLAMSPAARAVLADELARAERKLSARPIAKKAARHLRTLSRKLYPYQLEGVTRFLETARLLLADDMGLGKTTQAIAACHALHREGAVRRGILIVPASLKSQWLREWQETTDVAASVVDGTPKERARQYRSLESGFLILGYEQLLRDFAHVQAIAPDIVVLDEAQRIKNWATKSALYVKALTPRYRLVLTGTPMENRLEELASVLDWIDDLALAPKWRLDAWHTTSAGDGGRGTTGARNLDTLRTRLAPCMLRRVRKEVLSQLPSRTDTCVPVTMTEQQREEHDALTPSISQLAARARSRPLTQPEFLRLMQLLTTQRMISNGLGQLRFDELWPTYQHARPDDALLDGLFSPKLVELRRLIDDLVLEQQRKVVVFSQWRRMLRLAEWSVRDRLENEGLRAVFFTGAESQRARTQSVIDFHDDDAVRVMFLSDAGGVGLNLQRAASACINLELPWNPAVLEQRIGRIYRLGQKRPIDVYNLASDYGIEARIADLVANKRALFTGLFDGSSDAVQFSRASSFMADVQKIVAGVPGAAARSPEAVPATEGAADGGDSDTNEDAAATDALSASPTPAPFIASAQTAQLFAGVAVRRTSAGGVVLEAAPEAASSLLAMFEGMAQLLRSASAPPQTRP